MHILIIYIDLFKCVILKINVLLVAAEERLDDDIDGVDEIEEEVDGTGLTSVSLDSTSVSASKSLTGTLSDLLFFLAGRHLSLMAL
jgi:hypothetical protein